MKTIMRIIAAILFVLAFTMFDGNGNPTLLNLASFAGFVFIAKSCCNDGKDEA